MTENPIKSYSQNTGVSLSSIASKMGVHRSILTRLSKGSQSTSLESAIKLKRATNGVITADALGEYLFPEASTPPEKILETDSPSELAGEDEEAISGEVCAEMEQSQQF